MDAVEIDAIVKRGRKSLAEQRPVPSWAKNSDNPAAFSIPAPVKLDYRWVKAGETVNIGKYSIDCGFFYLGTSMRLVNGDTEASLINPALPFPQKFKASPLGANEPEKIDYAELNLLQRREYIAWLAGGRSSESVNTWVITLFLIGLERRVIEDSKRGLVPVEEIRAIRDEVERLMLLYHLNREAAAKLSAFFQYIELSLNERKLYTAPVPPAMTNCTNSVYFIYMCSQYAEDKIPLCAEALFEFFCECAEFKKPDFFRLCFNEFKRLFIHYFNENYKDAVFLTPKKPAKKYKLTLEYLPLSANASRSRLSFNIRIQPDFLESINAAHELSLRCQYELLRYANCRYEEGTINKKRLRYSLPVIFWNEDTVKKAHKLAAYVREKKQIKCDAAWIFEQLDIGGAFETQLFYDIVRPLEALNIAAAPDSFMLEPDLCETSTVYLFSFKDKLPVIRKTRDYKACFSAIKLAAFAVHECVPQLDSMYYCELKLFEEPCDYFYESLRFNYYFLCKNPPSYKNAVQPFLKQSKKTVRNLISYINIIFDGYKQYYDIEYKTVSFFEKLCKTLHIDAKELYSFLHSGSSAGSPAGAQLDFNNLNLDTGKIKKLRTETEKVAKFLSGIFDDSEFSEPDAPQNTDGIIGLDTAHSAFLRALSVRESWTRKDAEAEASRHGLFLDGAVEAINEAAFAEFDEMLIEEEVGVFNTSAIAARLSG
jgi:hypothetical protein